MTGTDGEPPAADYPSRNGATASAWNDSFHRLVVLAYILAAAMPPIGLILGLVVVVRGAKANSRHGLWIIVVSIIAAVIWALIIASGALTATTSD